MYEPVVLVPADVASALALARMPTCTPCLSPTGTRTASASNAAGGWDRVAEKGEVPAAFDDAVAMVAQSLPARRWCRGSPRPRRFR